MKDILKYPKDSPSRKIASAGRAIVHSSFDSNKWDYKEVTGNDFGIDAIIEYSNNDEFRNEKFECQIKATNNISIIRKGNIIAFNKFPVITLNYALNSRLPFFFLLVDVNKKYVYFVQLNEYVAFKENYNTQSFITIHIPLENRLDKNEQAIISAITNNSF